MKPWVSKLIVDAAVEMPVEERVTKDAVFADWYRSEIAEAAIKDGRAGDVNLQRLKDDPASRLLKCDYEASLRMLSDAERVARYLKGIPDRKRDAAATKGTEVHKHLEALAKFSVFGIDSGPVQVLDEHLPYLDSYTQFLKDFPITYTEIEATVYSDKYGYAGQVDAFATYNGKNILLDYKTGDKGIKTSIALQLAAYAGADFLGREDGTKDPIPDFDEYWGVSITDKGYEVIPVNVTEETFNYFLGVRETALWMGMKKSDVLGKALKPLKVAA